ncbi:MAG TPA: GlsB/YeaQ/YmgE family stress response membrane protein [Blastocatellia bacterium]|nr:GlsB/YeaQ/YmgE family stress response membrane protein [Blastocatellia bacterium]
MDLLGIIGWLVVGLVVGALARLIMPGRDEMGCLMTALLGIAGGVVGGLVGSLIFGPPDQNAWFRPGWILSLLGALLLLWLWRMFRSRA